MKKDNINNANLYYHLSQNMKSGLEYLKRTDFSTLNDGKYEIDGKNVYAIVQSYISKPLEQCKFEAHRKYTDIQFIIEGEEQMGVANIEDFVSTTEYDEEKDIVFLTPKNDCKQEFLIVSQNEFVIFEPSDAHMSSIAVEEPSFVKKVVVKVLNC